MLRRTQDPLKRDNIFDYRIITFFDSSFQMIRLMSSFVTPYRVSYNPNKQAFWFGLFPFRSPLLRESNFLSLPPGTKMFQFSDDITHAGFPHSEISGSKLTYSSPKHIVVSNVLHRLLVPRHPPCALNNLIYVSILQETRY
ncbi:Uncharacterised protein [Staphylococcus aureus]|nr:Uncharacterised protein [Staphylococcus aureus]